jgi:hypothetical protein
MLLSAGPGSAVAAPARGCKPLNTGFPGIISIKITNGTCSLAVAVARVVKHNKSPHGLPKRIGPLHGDRFVCSYRPRYVGGGSKGPAGDFIGFAAVCRSDRTVVTFLTAS